MKKVYIYQRTCTGKLQHMNYTESGFKSYRAAHAYLKGKRYNASATIVSRYNLSDANRIYGEKYD